MNNKMIHILMISALVILGLVLIKVLIRHYWLLLFIWLFLPFIRLWLTGDTMRAQLSLELHRFAKKVLIGTAVVLSFVNLVNFSSVRHDVGKEIIDGYRIVRSNDCEAPEGELGDISPPPEVCFVEDLSQVAWYGHVILYVMDWAGIILVILIPAATTFTGEEGLKKKEME